MSEEITEVLIGSEEPKPKRKSPFILITLVIAILLIGIVAGYFLFFNNENSKVVDDYFFSELYSYNNHLYYPMASDYGYQLYDITDPDHKEVISEYKSEIDPDLYYGWAGVCVFDDKLYVSYHQYSLNKINFRITKMNLDGSNEEVIFNKDYPQNDQTVYLIDESFFQNKIVALEEIQKDNSESVNVVALESNDFERIGEVGNNGDILLNFLVSNNDNCSLITQENEHDFSASILDKDLKLNYKSSFTLSGDYENMFAWEPNSFYINSKNGNTHNIQYYDIDKQSLNDCYSYDDKSFFLATNVLNEIIMSDQKDSRSFEAKANQTIKLTRFNLENKKESNFADLNIDQKNFPQSSGSDLTITADSIVKCGSGYYMKLDIDYDEIYSDNTSVFYVDPAKNTCSLLLTVDD